MKHQMNPRPTRDHSAAYQDSHNIEDITMEDMTKSNKQGSNSSSFFIRISTHPTASISDQFVSLDNLAVPNESAPDTNTVPIPSKPLQCPWAPFRTRADFEYAEIAVCSKLPKEAVDAQLHGIHTDWAENAKITLRDYSDMIQSLTAARHVSLKVGTVEESYKGVLYTFSFNYRNPWEWIVSLVTDPTLAQSIAWYPVHKFLHQEGKITRLIDEPQTSDTWWKVQDSLKRTSDHPHCFLPLLIWLDKGNVTRKVKVHPIIARASFLPSVIRNASGNGSGILLGYVPSVSSILGHNDSTKPSEVTQLRRFRQKVYHKVLGKILGTLCKPAEFGEAVTCADTVTRVLYPGIPYAALDGEEAWTYACSRAASADFPCPRCLVPHDSLDAIMETFTQRTTETMRQVFLQASSASTETARNTILQSFGLHLIENSLWCLQNSSPYEAISYDKLHADDVGKWGKHLWPLLVLILERLDLKGKLNQKQVSVMSPPTFYADDI
ncbi:hypothetical protein VKT23_010655 [Stygiomarasmius scandens]|uniref:Uncharacterized protein n=1 Tax=Marasmiellus scandens TaxID=2682957 RepID=A0ABR1JAY2_9AGAR